MRLDSGSLRLSATDLANHLGCRRLTELDRAVAEGRREKSDWASSMLALLQERGDAHEKAYVEHLAGAGLRVLDLSDVDGDEAAVRTVDAMGEGVDVIVQAALRDGRWGGLADFLLKVPAASELGDWSYEVVDTKLAQETRGGTVLQLCLYSDLVGKQQGRAPELMHVVKPGDGFPRESFRYADFQAYYRLVRDQLEAVVGAPPADRFPMPVAQCDICAWWKVCDEKRHADDHLCLVAGIGTLHIHELNRQGITSLEQFAEEPAAVREPPRRGNEDTYERAHRQARIQHEGRRRGEPVYELIRAEPGDGLARLPEPDDGDIFLDFEADPFVEGGGLEYLLGFLFKDDGGEYEYRGLWGLSRGEERRAFEQFIMFVMERLEEHPGLHIYHYSPYEPAALKRLMGRHASCGPELDWLLRGERFIDLYAVVKQGIRASVERYSLKDLEVFFAFERSLPLPEASAALRRMERALELEQVESLQADDQAAVEAYNREDCEATLKLREWLEGCRAEALDAGHDLPRPEIKRGDASEGIEERDARIAEVAESLLGGLPEEREEWGEAEYAVWLLAHQLEYFVREDKCAWWEFFRIHELEHDDLLEERKAVTGLEPIGPGEGGTARCPAHRYRYPPQEVALKSGDEVHEVGSAKVGTVLAVDQASRTVDVKKMQATVGLHPRALMVKEVVPARPLDSSLLAFARAVAEHGVDGDGPFRAGRDLLLKRTPRLSGELDGGPLRRDGEVGVDAAVRLAASLDHGVLPIQGPPGAGKTYAGARMIVALARAGKRVGVTAVSHKVVRNLLKEVLEAAAREGVSLEVVHKCTPEGDPPAGLHEARQNGDALAAINHGMVVGGVAWLWAGDDAVESLDYLFVDEAGQMSLVHVLASARAAANIVLLGDPQQLEQPQRGVHPEGSEVAALDHVLDGAKTIPPDRGLFLDVTWRLHPDICAFTSEVFYEQRLTSKPGLERQTVRGDTPFAGSGLCYVPVDHRGNQTRSPEEVQAIERVVQSLLGGATWTDADEVEHPLRETDILVVAPYNAQVGALETALPAGVEVGTVDRFQGQQAPVVIYSMTSSTAEDAPRGMSFLYSPNRLNVATSRAKCVCILVASPRILEPSCRVPDQMKWANGLCRYRELARDVVI